MTEQETYMAQALALAREAAAAGEVPVGCVIVRGGRGKEKKDRRKTIGGLHTGHRPFR